MPFDKYLTNKPPDYKFFPQLEPGELYEMISCHYMSRLMNFGDFTPLRGFILKSIFEYPDKKDEYCIFNSYKEAARYFENEWHPKILQVRCDVIILGSLYINDDIYEYWYMNFTPFQNEGILGKARSEFSYKEIIQNIREKHDVEIEFGCTNIKGLFSYNYGSRLKKRDGSYE